MTTPFLSKAQSGRPQRLHRLRPQRLHLDSELHGSALTTLALNDLFLFWSKHRMALALTSGWCKSRSKGSVLLVMMRRAWQERQAQETETQSRGDCRLRSRHIYESRAESPCREVYPRGSTTRPELLMQLDEQGLVFKANIRTNGYSVAS
jgi:hypothetical protein